MIAQFALRLICGMSLMWAIVPRRDVTSGFFRIQMLVTLGLAVLAALTAGQFAGLEFSESSTEFASTAKWLSVGIAACSFAGSVAWTLERRGGGAIIGFVVLGLSTAAMLLLSAPQPESATNETNVLAVLSEISTATMVGGFATAMLLGHWYLTAPTMTIRPLSRLNLFLAVFTIGRFTLSLTGLILGGESLVSQTHWMWLALRWGAGIIGTAILITMVHRILKYRNTQSATGVLFVGMLLSFTGELAAALLSAELEAPF